MKTKDLVKELLKLDQDKEISINNDERMETSTILNIGVYPDGTNKIDID